MKQYMPNFWVAQTQGSKTWMQSIYMDIEKPPPKVGNSDVQGSLTLQKDSIKISEILSISAF